MLCEGQGNLGDTTSQNGRHHLLQSTGTGGDAQGMLGAIRIALGAFIQGCSSLKVFPFCSSWLCRFLHISVLKNGPVSPKRRQSLFPGLSHTDVAHDPEEMNILHPPGGMSPPPVPGLPSLPWSTHSWSVKQWAAVRIHRALMMVPPQMCFPWLWMLTSHGNSPGWTSVPVPILLPVVWKDS